MHKIEETKSYRIALHHLGFRPFFLLGTLFSVLSVLVWAGLYHIDTSLSLDAKLSSVSWHAHEMVYGYALAVIAGFLLTAVRNWTGVQTLHGFPLMMLALLWSGARLSPFFTWTYALEMMTVLDLVFNFILVIAILHPIIKVRQWGQMGIWLLLLMLLLGNGLFYLGLLDILQGGIHLGLYTGFYVIIFLILVMGRRVIPFFIEKGVDEDVSVQNNNWVDISSLVVMPVFLIAEVFIQRIEISAFCALVLFMLQSKRLYDWHTPGIWKKPLLWSLYIAYAWIVTGFAMKAIHFILPFNPMLVIHAFVYGGIGLLTLSMMARVSLGHTGRNLFEPPVILRWLFLILIAGALARVLMPLVIPGLYDFWIGLSQLMWVLSFGGFLFLNAPILIKPRIDGRYG